MVVGLLILLPPASAYTRNRFIMIIGLASTNPTRRGCSHKNCSNYHSHHHQQIEYSHSHSTSPCLPKLTHHIAAYGPSVCDSNSSCVPTSATCMHAPPLRQPSASASPVAHLPSLSPRPRCGRRAVVAAMEWGVQRASRTTTSNNNNPAPRT